MKKTDFRVMDNRDVVAQFDGKAIAFIKSRKLTTRFMLWQQK